MAETFYFNSEELRDLEEKFRYLIEGQGVTMLVVDKAMTYRRTIVNELRNLGFESIIDVAKGTEALGSLGNCDGKIVLLTELDLPLMDGAALVKSFLNAVPEGIALVMGDRAPKEKITAAVGNGAQAYLQKPLDFQELRRKLAELGVAVKRAMPNL